MRGKVFVLEISSKIQLIFIEKAKVCKAKWSDVYEKYWFYTYPVKVTQFSLKNLCFLIVMG